MPSDGTSPAVANVVANPASGLGEHVSRARPHESEIGGLCSESVGRELGTAGAHTSPDQAQRVGFKNCQYLKRARPSFSEREHGAVRAVAKLTKYPDQQWDIGSNEDLVQSLSYRRGQL